MRSKKHWEQCKQLSSFMAANQVALELREIAKRDGYDMRGIHVLSKKKAYESGRNADAMVTWYEGPEDWSRAIEHDRFIGVHVEQLGGDRLTFHDIELPPTWGDD